MSTYEQLYYDANRELNAKDKLLEAAKLREADLQQAHCEATKRAVHIGLERDVARNALEIANDLLKRIEELLSSHVGTRERMRVRNIIKQTLVDTSNHTAALAERDQIRGHNPLHGIKEADYPPERDFCGISRDQYK